MPPQAGGNSLEIQVEALPQYTGRLEYFQQDLFFWVCRMILIQL